MQTAAREEIRDRLELTQQGKPANTAMNYKTVFQNDPLLKGAIRKNLLTERTDIVKPLGWYRESSTLTDVDIKYLLLYFEEHYGLTVEKKIEDAALVIANENRYHPVCDFLNGLEWDGQERIRFLKSLLSARLVDINQSVLNDYIDFSLQLCKPVDILAGKKRIVKLHNEITDEIIEKSNKLSKITIPETPLKYLKLPKEFVLLKSQKALINEGRINHNCVGAYGQDIISGKCVIYSANIQNEHLTIEIKFIKIKNEYKFYVAQCYKACNIPCSPDILAYVRECLAKCSDKAIKKYIKAVKKMKHSPVRNGKEAK